MLSDTLPETVPMPNHGTMTASSQGSSSATKSRRQPVWTDEETRAFIQVWGDDAVQGALASNYRTVAQFQWIADEMRARGYNRDWEQCRERAKVLRRGFKEIVDGNSNAGHGRRVWPYYEELNRFLCIKQNLVVPRLSGSNARPPVDRRRREHRETQDAAYEPPSSVGKSDKGTFEEPDGDCLLLPESAGSQQSEANMDNQVASPAANSDLSMDGSAGPGTPTDPLPSNDSISGEFALDFQYVCNAGWLWSSYPWAPALRGLLDNLSLGGLGWERLFNPILFLRDEQLMLVQG